MKQIDKQVIEVEKLREWPENPRDIKPEELERLKNHMQELGVYKPLLIVLDEGGETGEVIGGNMRLRALKEMGERWAWVRIVNPKDDNEKFMLAMQDNDQVGTYDDEQLAELISQIPDFPMDDFRIDAGAPTSLDFLHNQFKARDDKREEDKNTIDHKKDVYDNNPIKQIVLYFFPTEYEAVQQKLDRIGQTLETEDTGQTVVKLLDIYDQQKTEGNSHQKTGEF